MIEESSNRSLTVFFVAVLLILMFFILFAYFFLGQGPISSRLVAPGMTWQDDSDVPTDRTKRPPATRRPLPRLDGGLPAVDRGAYIPQTLAERAYFSAITKARRKKTRILERRKRREKVQEFLDSPLGQNMAATFELAKRGGTDAAKNFINGLLDDLVDMDVEVQRLVVMATIDLYRRDNDKQGLGEMMIRYLNLARRHGDARTSNQELDEFIRDIEGRMGELTRGNE